MGQTAGSHQLISRQWHVVPQDGTIQFSPKWQQGMNMDDEEVNGWSDEDCTMLVFEKASS